MLRSGRRGRWFESSRSDFLPNCIAQDRADKLYPGAKSIIYNLGVVRSRQMIGQNGALFKIEYIEQLVFGLLVEPMADVSQLTLPDEFLPDGFGPLDGRDDSGHLRVRARA